METNRYKVSSRTYIKYIFRPLLLNWLGIAIAVLFIPIAILSFYDIRFFLVLLMVLFLVIPLILFFVYIIYGFKPESRLSIVEKSVEIMDDNLIIKFSDNDCKCIKNEEIIDAKITKDNIVLTCKKAGKFIFIIPQSSFKNDYDKKSIICHFSKFQKV